MLNRLGSAIFLVFPDALIAGYLQIFGDALELIDRCTGLRDHFRDAAQLPLGALESLQPAVLANSGAAENRPAAPDYC